MYVGNVENRKWNHLAAAYSPPLLVDKISSQKHDHLAISRKKNCFEFGCDKVKCQPLVLNVDNTIKVMEESKGLHKLGKGAKYLIVEPIATLDDTLSSNGLH